MKSFFTQTDWTRIFRTGKAIYSLGELMRVSGLPLSSMRRAAQRLVQRGLILKLGKELYANSFFPPNLEEVAGVLYPPSYISLESALHIHGIMDQAPHMVTCVSLNKTKTFRTALGKIAYSHVKKELFFGYEIRNRYPLAQPEKAVLDFVYIQRRNGSIPPLDEWDWKVLNLEKVQGWAGAYPKTVALHIDTFIQFNEIQK